MRIRERWLIDLKILVVIDLVKGVGNLRLLKFFLKNLLKMIDVERERKWIYVFICNICIIREFCIENIGCNFY